MRLLDLFCGAGGAAVGYHRAGFTEIVGIDLRPQPRYPFHFIQADALKPPVRLEDFDAIHASPPCQAFTPLRKMWNSKEHPDHVDTIRTTLTATGLPFVIENVPGAPVNPTVTLCGTMFGLGTGGAELRRHRHFETNFDVGLIPPCAHHERGGRVIGVYGGHGRDRRRSRVIGVCGHSGGTRHRDGTQQFSVAERREAMGIDWMTGNELSEAIPPAYTEFIGRQLIAQLRMVA